MREFLTSGQVGNIELNEQKRIRSLVVERWQKLGFTEGLEGQMMENMATLYENEAKSLIQESTSADSSGSFETVVFPIIRRVFSKLLANDIVSVQAMNLPIGRLFFILPVTSEREWTADNYGADVPGGVAQTGSHAGLMGYDRINRNQNAAYNPPAPTDKNRYYLPDAVIPNVGTNNAPPVTQYMQKSLYDLFYNDFLFDQSKGKVNIRVAATADPVIMNGSVAYGNTDPNNSDSPGDIQFNAISGTYPPSPIDGAVRAVILKVTGFSSFNAGQLTGPDGNEMDSESFLASLKVLNNVAIIDTTNTTGGTQMGYSTFAQYSSLPFRLVTQKYGHAIVDTTSPTDGTGSLYLEVDLSAPNTSASNKTIDGFIGVDPTTVFNASATSGATFLVSWAQYDSLELETEIGEVSFKLDSVTVSVEERKLRATWSPELAQDVAAFHSIDAEAELTAILSEQIAAEIDREILRDLRKAAPWQARWDFNGWRRMSAFSTNYTQKDWNQELMTKINQISAQINKATLRGGANFIVVSSEVSAVFDNLEYFHVTDASAESDQYNMGIEKIGTLSGRYQVYRDPYSPSWSIIIGHKGKSLLDTGYIYAPYVPMQLTPTMYNPFNFAPVKGILTRYAKKLVNNRYYGHVRVDGLVTWNINELR
jgi:hypothetical protein